MAIPQNETEILALKSFRPMVQDLGFSDGVLMRFLRARNLNKAQAEDMIRKFIIWRAEAECNKYLGWTVPADLLRFDAYLCGFDHEERPVFWVAQGFWPSVRDLFDRGMAEDILKYCGYIMEKAYQLVLRTKHQQIVSLVDNEGITFSKVFYEMRSLIGVQTLMGLLRDYEANFPELLHKAYMFNTPLAFMWGWKILSPCFSNYTLSKVNLYRSGEKDNEMLESTLYKNLPKSAIPPKYGGSAVLTNLNDDLMKVWEDYCSAQNEE